LVRQEEREFLQLMAADNFAMFLTVDQNLGYQQNLANAGIAVVVLVAPSNRIVDLAPLMVKVRNSLASLKPGDLLEVCQ
jgi:hypothetical protein